MSDEKGPNLRLPAIAVLGPWRGGTSLVTGILQALGVDVGGPFFVGHTGYPTYEDLELRRRSLQCFGENQQDWGPRGTRRRRVELLAERIRGLRQTADTVRMPGGVRRVAVGGKHPVLCGLVDEIAEAWAPPGATGSDVRGVRFVSVHRPVEAVHESWGRPEKSGGPAWWPRSDQREAVADLIRRRDESLQNFPHTIVDFDQLRRDPADVIHRLAADCDLPDHRVAAAIERVLPPKNVQDRQAGRGRTPGGFEP